MLLIRLGLIVSPVYYCYLVLIQALIIYSQLPKLGKVSSVLFFLCIFFMLQLVPFLLLCVLAFLWHDVLAPQLHRTSVSCCFIIFFLAVSHWCAAGPLCLGAPGVFFAQPHFVIGNQSTLPIVTLSEKLQFQLNCLITITNDVDFFF